MSDPLDAFESWVLRRVAQAVEAGEVPAELLAELRSELERAGEPPREEGHARAVQDMAEMFGLPVDRVEKLLAAFEAQPPEMRERLRRRIVELWLAWERATYRARGPAREADGTH